MKNTKLIFATPCDYALASQDGKASAMGMFDHMGVQNIPSIAPVFYIFSIIEGSSGSKHLLNIEIIKPSGASLGGGSYVQITLGQSGRANFISRIEGIPIEEIGRYSVKIKVDNEEVGKTSFDILKFTPNGQTNNTVQGKD